MVLISDKKYACETCIKGHRSSTCKHTDRPLFEIKKKGRPVTQCEHCRELRKTKQVHVKCICTKAEGTAKGFNKTLESAAFPNGLPPEALEASVALQLLSEGASSDSDHGACSCLNGGECNCCTPRQSAPRRRNKEASQSGTSTPPQQSQLAPNPSDPAFAHLRPVLPKPTARDYDHHSHLRPHHENSHYSPYGRAYDFTRYPHGYINPAASSSDLLPHIPNSNPSNYPTSFPSTTSSPAPNDERASTSMPGLPSIDSWAGAFQSPIGEVMSSLCGCSDGCGCSGCLNAPPGSAVGAGNCSTGGRDCNAPRCCLNCSLSTTYAVPDSLPPNTALSISEWARQVDNPFSSHQPQTEHDLIPSPFDIPGSSTGYSGETNDFLEMYLPPALPPPPAVAGSSTVDSESAEMPGPSQSRKTQNEEYGFSLGDDLVDFSSSSSSIYDQLRGYISVGPDGFEITDPFSGYKVGLDDGLEYGAGVRSRAASESSSEASGESWMPELPDHMMGFESDAMDVMAGLSRTTSPGGSSTVGM